MISLVDFVFYYTDVEKPALDHISLKIPDGAFVLVTGPSGSGKTTFLRVLNGLVPHFYGGRIGGGARIYGLEAKSETVRRLSAFVGMVFQDSTAQFVTDTVESEIAFGLENSGMASDEIVRRVDETAGLMGIENLIGRKAATLSGGERQKTAVASVLAMRPRAIALDEPTAELDPEAAADLLDLLVKLNREQGLTVILAEHRLERIIQFADNIIELRSGRAEMGPTQKMAETIVNAPPVIELGREMSWHPPPLSVEEAKERVELEPLTPTLSPGRRGSIGGGAVAACAEKLSFSYEANTVLENIDLTFNDGEITALMGPNGAGKTTLLKLLCGLLKPDSGRVSVGGLNTTTARAADIFKKAGYVPQRPGALLFAETVYDEIASAAPQPRPPAGKAGDDGITRTGKLIDDFGLAEHVNDYPRDLSQGEQQRVALAAILANDPAIILFDEPTHGLDFAAKRAVSDRLRQLADSGKAVIVATHDVETAARTADRVIVIDKGKIAADGRTSEVMPLMPMLRTQMNEIFGDGILTVEDVLKGVV